MERLFRERYAGFTVKHFHEHLRRSHGFTWGYTWTKTFLQSRGLVAKAPRRGAHRRKRPRRPMVGMMLHQDGSRHAWLSGLAPLDLVITLDDATGAIYSAILVAEEGTASTFAGLAETIAAHGLPCALYTDRGSHYSTRPKRAARWRATCPPRSGGRWRNSASSISRRIRRRRAAAASVRSGPCRTGCRRNWGWPGSRDDIAAANRFLRETYLPAHNARFAVAPAEGGSAFVPVAEAQWRDVLCFQEERVVAPDNTVVLARRAPADPAASGAGALRAGEGAGARVSATASSPCSMARAAWCAGPLPSPVASETRPAT